MKIIIGLILVSFVLFSCKSKIEFPKKIISNKTDKHIRVKGTKVFGLIPKDYTYVKELARYQKNDKLYIQIIEPNTPSSFIKAKSNITKQAIEAQGAKVDVLEDIKLNDFDAIYGEGPSKKPGETKLMLFFGDDSFIVMIAGVCKTDDIDGLREIQEIFKSIYYDKSMQVDPLELSNFEFDQSITSFKYTMTASNLFMYSENGAKDIQNSTANSFQIGAMPKMTIDQAEKFSNDLPWRFAQSGYILDNKSIIKTQIGSYPALVLETKISFENKDGILYQAFLVGDSSCVLFLSSAYNDINNYLSKYKKTVESITIK